MDRPTPPLLLCILDGFGLNPNPLGNAVAAARKPNFDSVWNHAPSTTLVTFGERVGLPEGQMGNSEVGHMNIGAGRVMEQSLLRISRALRGTFLRDSPTYRGFLDSLTPESTVHLIGLYSEGGVHSHAEHLELLLDQLSTQTTNPLRLHLITDGRDTGPRTGLSALRALEEKLPNWPRVSIASVSGRYYAMDRDKRWERTELAYRAIVAGEGPSAPSASAALEKSYAHEIGDEFVLPTVVGERHPFGREDGVILWNFREDRARQITAALCAIPDEAVERLGMPHTIRSQPPVPAARVLCFTDYSADFHLPFLFSTPENRNHLGEYLSTHGITQLRTAETEKYPHVTYFFNASNETPYPGEERVLIPSPRDVPTYDLKPEMSAAGVTDVVVQSLRDKKHQVIIVNLANSDMVGHTGVMEAAIRAVECVDTSLGRMLEALKERNGIAVIIADHGNAEQLINYVDGTPHTAHTMFPVPMIVVGAPELTSLASGGALCDVAPTILDLLGLPQPPEMSGRSLLVRKK